MRRLTLFTASAAIGLISLGTMSASAKSAHYQLKQSSKTLSQKPKAQPDPIITAIEGCNKAIKFISKQQIFSQAADNQMPLMENAEMNNQSIANIESLKKSATKLKEDIYLFKSGELFLKVHIREENPNTKNFLFILTEEKPVNEAIQFASLVGAVKTKSIDGELRFIRFAGNPSLNYTEANKIQTFLMRVNAALFKPLKLHPSNQPAPPLTGYSL